MTHIDEDVRMIEGWGGAHAHEFPRLDLNLGNTGIVFEIWNGVVNHREAPERDRFRP